MILKKFPFEKIEKWYQKNWRHTLPWRQYFHVAEKDLGYHVWLSEIILQQTQATRCIDFYEKILQKFPTVENLAQTNYGEFFPYYKWLGYYSRAKNMLKAAKYVVENFDWIFPQETQELEKIPGVWPYTAQAIRAFAYNIPTLSFDTNLEKIFSRFYHANRFQKLTREEKEQILVDFKNTWISARDINAALMDFASIIDINNSGKIDWENYPLTESKFYESRWKLEPVKQKKSSSFPSKEAYVIAILHENHKIYFSWKKNIPSQWEGWSKTGESFSPFLIWKNTWNPRTMIQNFFLQKYWLEVSVRPPEIKSYKHEAPYMVCYAQIQSGTHNFELFENLQVRGNEESLAEIVLTNII